MRVMLRIYGLWINNFFKVCRDLARRGWARRGAARRGAARLGKARIIWRGRARHVAAGLCMAGQGKARINDT